jgi:hypothetical protein
MSAIGIYNTRYDGGECYAACMETYTLYFILLCSYNPSIAICWKGCDYAVGRVNNPDGRI